MSNYEDLFGDDVPSAATLRKLSIVRAVEELSDEMPFDKLTVRIIANRAGISRQAFYSHFTSKYAIVPWYWDLFIERYLGQTGLTLSWFEGAYRMMHVVTERRQLFRYFYTAGLDDYESFMQHACRKRSEYLRKAIEAHYGKGSIDEELDFQIRFFSQQEGRIFAEKVLSSDDFDKEKLARFFEGCVPRRLHDMLLLPEA